MGILDGFMGGGASSTVNNTDNSFRDNSTRGDVLSGVYMNFGNNNVLDWASENDTSSTHSSEAITRTDQKGGAGGGGGGLQMDAALSAAVTTGPNSDAKSGDVAKDGGGFKDSPLTVGTTPKIDIKDNNNTILILGGIILVAVVIYKRFK